MTDLPSDTRAQAQAPAAAPAAPGATTLALAALGCGAAQALQPAYTLGSAALAPMPLALALMAAVAVAHGRSAWTAAALGTLVGALARALSMGAGGGGATSASWAALMDPGHGAAGLWPAVWQAMVLAAEAALAAALLRRAGDADRLRLDTSDRLRQLTLGCAGPAAALGALGALVAVVGGFAAWTSTNPPPLAGGAALAAHALGRWLVDGVALVLGPAIGLCWLGRAAEPWPARRRLLAWPLLAVLVVLLIGLDQVARKDERRLEVRFAQEALTRQNQLQRLLLQPVAAVVGARGVLAVGGNDLSPGAFDSLATTWAGREPGLLALGWLEVEAVAGDTQARLVHAWRPPNAPPIGLLDGGGRVADANLRRTVAAALTADGVVSGVLTGAGDGGRPLLAIVQAVRSEGATAVALSTGTARAAFAVIDLQRQLGSALPAANDTDRRACVLDAQAETAADGEPGGGMARVLAGPPECASSPAQGAIRLQGGSLNLAGRPLTLLAVEPPTADNRLFTAVWLLGLPSVIGLAALATMLLALSGRMRRIEARVQERTAELQAEVTERREAQDALSHSEQRFRALFEAVNIGITLVDAQGRLTMVNPAFCRMMGAPAEQLMGRPLADFHLPDVPDEDGTAAAVAGPGARRQRYLTPDGRVLQVAASLRELRDSLGEPVATAAALHDLTPVFARREAERAREQADTANRTKSEFLASLSHELRAPLQAIVGFAQMVDGSPLEAGSQPQLQRTLRQIRQAGWHVLDMVNDVLDLSRLEAGTLRLELGPVALPDVVQEATTILEAAARQAGIPIALSLSPSAEWAQADALRLRQILLNLLGNAVRYNRPGGQVELRTRRGDLGEVRIDIEDTGVGIAPSQLDELFRPFHRLGREREPARGDEPLGGEGAGIGLAICRRLAAQMHGRLEVVSQPGEGSVFSLFLPSASGPHAARSELTGARPLMSQITIGQVLCVDDDPTDTATVQRLLADQPGLTLRCAATAAEGLAMAHEADVVLLDLDLPDLPGLEVMRRLQADTRFGKLPVIVVSAETRPDRIDACLDAGAVAFLDKPLDGATLLRTIQRALDSD